MDRIKIIWVGRFVDFKISSIIMMINFIKENPKYFFTLVGYGNYKRKIERYIKFNNIKNIKIIGKSSPEEINNIIKENHIGYCMGTSVLETAKLGLPTLIAPMLPSNSYKKFKEPVCLGIFGENSGYNLGETVLKDNMSLKKIKTCVENIVNNYEYYSRLTLKKIQQFDIELIAPKYYLVIKNSSMKLQKNEKIFPKVPIIKYFLKRIYIKLLRY
ncbi:hypothetical protein [Marinitoga lauensis]|uniref:hypothetical protein n=1 Tax=Marinitoga lauensis TaxID=2201189 RepID=UPI001981BDC5|nr:hypothetical protein [Marinitoga lauensis]